jgi:hypothetical protein
MNMPARWLNSGIARGIATDALGAGVGLSSSVEIYA